MKEQYVKLSPREHVLKRPGMYIGSLTTELKKMFVIEDFSDFNTMKFVSKMTYYNPGFFKIFDEILTNCADHYIRTGKVKSINIVVGTDHISIENDGPGIPIEINKVENIYNPELIFGHLMTGSNFDETEERKWGGMNGLGAKLTNIYSKKFIIETADTKNKYVQEFSENLDIIGKPVITKSKDAYTKITFYPDFEKFGMTEITKEVQQILLKRALDISVYCPKAKILYNNELLPVKSFKDYMTMHVVDGTETYYEKLNEDWEIGLAQSPEDDFQHVSMVNGISTYIGGTHVNYISAQIVNAIKESLEKKYKKVTIKVNDIKSKLFLFLNCKIVNPDFDTQTKENLKSKMTAQLAGNAQVSEKFIKQILASPIVEDIMNYIELREKADLAKLNKGKTSKVKVKKLDDANRAGTSESDKCAIFLAEGDCLIENTEITIIRDGDKINIKIKDVKLGDAVITHENNIGVISAISKKIEKSVNIKLKNGEILICSEKHRWYVYDKIDKKFIFIKTKDIDKNKHKMIINKNVFFDDFIKILEIEKCKIDKYDYILTLSTGEMFSSETHKFSVFDKDDYKFEMIECKNLNKEKHFIVSYEKI